MRYRLLLVGLLSARAGEPVHYLMVERLFRRHGDGLRYHAAYVCWRERRSKCTELDYGSWSAASDNVTPASGITYLSIKRLIAGRKLRDTVVYDFVARRPKDASTYQAAQMSMQTKQRSKQPLLPHRTCRLYVFRTCIGQRIWNVQNLVGPQPPTT